MGHQNEGFIKIYRSLFESKLWLSEPFTKAQAWIDLIGLANYRDLKRIEGAETKIYHRGEVVTSVLTLSKRWGWSQEKVRNFLLALENDQKARAKKRHNGIVLTIENYDVYQSQFPKTESETETKPRTDREQTESKPRQKKKEKKEKKDKEREGAREDALRPCGPNGRLALTEDELRSFCGEYSEAERFISELDEYKGATGKTYANDYAALKRWAKNDAKFSGGGQPQKAAPKTQPQKAEQPRRTSPPQKAAEEPPETGGPKMSLDEFIERYPEKSAALKANRDRLKRAAEGK